jgi:hypothetical protein
LDRKVTAYQITEYFDKFERSLVLPGHASTMDFSVEVFHNDNTLYRFEASDSTLTSTACTDLKTEVIDAMDRSGIYNLQVEFNPVHQNELRIQDGNVIFPDKNNVPIRNMTNTNFTNWFLRLCFLLGQRIHLIPDTNFFRRCYYSNYINHIRFANNNKNKLLMKIPRLEIIEVENKFNTNKANQNDKKEKVIQKGKERRIAFQTMGEILSMKNDGAEMLPMVDLFLLQSFTPLAGQGFADSWIRREIANNMDRLERDNIIGRDTIERSNAVFLTCDLMNALAAVAENLNTFYFFRIEEDKMNLGFSAYNRLSSLIINTSILFEQCECIIKSQTEEQSLKYKGIWKGKSLYDWQNNIILYEKSE